MYLPSLDLLQGSWFVRHNVVVKEQAVLHFTENAVLLFFYKMSLCFFEYINKLNNIYVHHCHKKKTIICMDCCL